MAGGKPTRVKVRPTIIALFTAKRDELMKEGARIKKARKEEIDEWFNKVKNGDKDPGEKKFPMNYTLYFTEDNIELWLSDTIEQGIRKWQKLESIEGNKIADIPLEGNPINAKSTKDHRELDRQKILEDYRKTHNITSNEATATDNRGPSLISPRLLAEFGTKKASTRSISRSASVKRGLGRIHNDRTQKAIKTSGNWYDVLRLDDPGDDFQDPGTQEMEQETQEPPQWTKTSILLAEELDDTFYNDDILDNTTCKTESTFNLTNGGHRGDCTFTKDVVLISDNEIPSTKVVESDISQEQGKVDSSQTRIDPSQIDTNDLPALGMEKVKTLAETMHYQCHFTGFNSDLVKIRLKDTIIEGEAPRTVGYEAEITGDVIISGYRLSSL